MDIFKKTADEIAVRSDLSPIVRLGAMVLRKSGLNACTFNGNTDTASFWKIVAPGSRKDGIEIYVTGNREIRFATTGRIFDENKLPRLAGYIVRSAINPALVLCTNGKFLAEGFFGPGHRVGARLYKTREGAERFRNGSGIQVQEEWI